MLYQSGWALAAAAQNQAGPRRDVGLGAVLLALCRPDMLQLGPRPVDTARLQHRKLPVDDLLVAAGVKGGEKGQGRHVTLRSLSSRYSARAAPRPPQNAERYERRKSEKSWLVRGASARLVPIASFGFGHSSMCVHSPLFRLENDFDTCCACESD